MYAVGAERLNSGYRREELGSSLGAVQARSDLTILAAFLRCPRLPPFFPLGTRIAAIQTAPFR